MRFYEKKIEVDVHDVDYNGTARASSLMKYIQSAAQTQLTESGLRSSIARYNRKRGVEKTSIHLFRHTFAKKYLVDCGGNAFTLQRLLGHSTLDMTKHYCTIFDADITRNFDNFSPLANFNTNSEKIKMPRR